MSDRRNLPDNYSDNPEALLHRPRRIQRLISPLSSPPAPPAPRFNWRPEAPEPPASEHRELKASWPIDTNQKPNIPAQFPSTPQGDLSKSSDKEIVQLFFNRLLRDKVTPRRLQGSHDTPKPPGAFVFTPMAEPSTSAGKGKASMADIPEDDQIEALKQQLQEAEERNEMLERRCERLDTLESLVHDMARETQKTRAPAEDHSFQSSRSNNPFAPYMEQGPVSPSPVVVQQAYLPAQTQLPPPVNYSTRPNCLTTPAPPAYASESSAQSVPMPTAAMPWTYPWAQSTPAVRWVPPQTAPGLIPPLSPRSPGLPPPASAAIVPTREQEPDSSDAHSDDSSSTVTASKIRLAEVPKYKGPYGKPTELFHWQWLTEQYFDVKDLNSDKERLKLLGSLLLDQQASAWFQSAKSELEGKSWSEVMDLFALGTLPEDWVADTEQQLRQLQIKPTETFDGFIERAQGLHRTISRFSRITQKELAQYICWGLPSIFNSTVRKDRLLLCDDFNMITFISRAKATWRVLVDGGQVKIGRSQTSASNPFLTNQSSVSSAGNGGIQSRAAIRSPEERAENAWRYKQWMKHLGLCLTCKKKCNNPNCTESTNTFISVPPPDQFNAGPRPPRNEPRPPAGAPTQRPAGRPVSSVPPPTRVAAVAELPELSDAELERYAEADRVLVACMEESKQESLRNESHGRALGAESPNTSTTSG